MSFNNRKELVEEGDTVMLYLGKNSLMSIQIDITKTHQTKFGAFPHQDFIRKAYGTKIYSKNRKGWIYLLHPNPELWTVTLPHRTQILYSTDISLITLELELKPGSIVVESGTGSGSLSHAIIRSIKPNGHLFTFDFHEQRVEKAREEFQQHGIGDFVTSACADACKDGFGFKNKADAVFLDLPSPWDAIPHAKNAFKKSGGRLCSFSPCIEQVQRTCDALRKFSFCEIKTVECLLRTLNVRTIPIPEANLGSKVFQDDTETGVQEDTESINKKVKVEICSDPHEKANVNKNLSEIISKNADNNNDTGEAEPQNTTAVRTITGMNSSGMVSKLTAKSKLGNINVLTSKASKEMPGHTGYLTFASLYPCWRKDIEE